MMSTHRHDLKVKEVSELLGSVLHPEVRSEKVKCEWEDEPLTHPDEANDMPETTTQPT